MRRTLGVRSADQYSSWLEDRRSGSLGSPGLAVSSRDFQHVLKSRQAKCSNMCVQCGPVYVLCKDASHSLLATHVLELEVSCTKVVPHPEIGSMQVPDFAQT